MEKNCDWIIANDVSNKSIGFDSNFNEVSIFYKNKKIKDEKLAMKKKSEISDEIIDRVIQTIKLKFSGKSINKKISTQK